MWLCLCTPIYVFDADVDLLACQFFKVSLGVSVSYVLMCTLEFFIVCVFWLVLYIVFQSVKIRFFPPFSQAVGLFISLHRVLLIRVCLSLFNVLICMCICLFDVVPMRVSISLPILLMSV